MVLLVSGTNMSRSSAFESIFFFFSPPTEDIKRHIQPIFINLMTLMLESTEIKMVSNQALSALFYTANSYGIKDI